MYKPREVPKSELELVNILNSVAVKYNKIIDKDKLRKYLKVRKIRRVDLARISESALPTVDKFLKDEFVSDRTELWITYCLSQLLGVKFDALLEAFKKTKEE